jgi:ubiquitin-protein ligase
MSIQLDEQMCIFTDLIKDSEMKIIKMLDGTNDVTICLNVNNETIKIFTDFNKFCLMETTSSQLNINKFNMTIVFRKKNPKEIIENIPLIFVDEKQKIKEIKCMDPFHIFRKIDEFSKQKIDYDKLEKELNSISSKHELSGRKNIPKELLLTPHQVCQLIINEIKKINRSKDYLHYVVVDESNPFSLFIRFKFNKETEVGKIFSKLEKDFGYDYVEIKLNLEPNLYPFIPPKLEYIRPKINLQLLLSLMNMEILKLENWTSTITLEYFITNLGTKLENIILDHIIPDDPCNGTSSIAYNKLEYELIKFASITKETNFDKIDINIEKPKLASGQSVGKYWKSGTGYGTDGSNGWDIKAYIKEQELQRDDLVKCLIKLNSLISESNVETLYDSILSSYIINQLKGINMLELEKNQKIYEQIFNILSSMINKTMPQHFINNIAMSINNLYNEIKLVFDTLEDSLKNESLLQTYCLAEWYLSKYQEPIKEITIPLDAKDQYCQIMKPLQFGTYEIPFYHRYHSHKDVKPEQKALMRILSEISSFKSGLPLNWESTIWVRVSKTNMHLFSFLISGPKDTPYENGLFEFHAYFPQNYPNKEPQVLIHTTGNGTVRFNPNLYDTGKVCLSLLGTWSGQEGEKWNAKTSTFLQVMVSIQSLILIEHPYFNEPGWEREMDTESGKQKSMSYNEKLYPATIKLAMNDMIKNPPNGFEDIIKNHFKMKKEEIKNKTMMWEQSSTKHKGGIHNNRLELCDLLDML